MEHKTGGEAAKDVLAAKEGGLLTQALLARQITLSTGFLSHSVAWQVSSTHFLASGVSFLFSETLLYPGGEVSFLMVFLCFEFCIWGMKIMPFFIIYIYI